MSKLVLLRHGQSQWNLENRFTGWVDVDISEQGEQEAQQAGAAIAKINVNWNEAHTSRLKRAQRTLNIVLGILKQSPPITMDSALNERYYGELQGMNKDECRIKFGEEQVHIWRRSYNVPPPGGESLEDTSKRSIPYFREYILKPLLAGQNVLVAAHGNSLRSIVMFIEKMTPEQILKTELATGVPYLYEFDSNGVVGGRKEIP